MTPFNDTVLWIPAPGLRQGRLRRNDTLIGSSPARAVPDYLAEHLPEAVGHAITVHGQHHQLHLASILDLIR